MLVGIVAPLYYQTDNISDAKILADTLGDQSREGYGNGIFETEIEMPLLCREIGVSANSGFEDIYAQRLHEFLKERKQE